MKTNAQNGRARLETQSPRRVLEDERGAIAILAGLAFPAIVMLVGGMLDFASIMYQRSVLQSATDAAAISAAMAMEERAIKLYANRAEAAESAEEKRLYEWLSDWETTHLDVLAELDRTLTEQVWNDNNFWPF